MERGLHWESRALGSDCSSASPFIGWPDKSFQHKFRPSENDSLTTQALKRQDRPEKTALWKRCRNLAEPLGVLRSLHKIQGQYLGGSPLGVQVGGWRCNAGSSYPHTWRNPGRLHPPWISQWEENGSLVFEDIQPHTTLPFSDMSGYASPSWGKKVRLTESHLWTACLLVCPMEWSFFIQSQDWIQHQLYARHCGRYRES